MNRSKRLLTVSIFLILAATFASMGACLDFSTPLDKINFHLQAVTNWKLFLSLGWWHMSTSPFSPRTSSGADPCRPFACCLSLCEFI